MGDENPIRTLGDYSKPSHEGYRNTIELLVRNNVVPLRSDTIRLMQNGCSFHGLRSEDPNQHLKDFLKLVDSLDLDGENRERTRLGPHDTQYCMEDPEQAFVEYASSRTDEEGDEFQDLHLNLPVLEVLAHASIYKAILDKYLESLELGKSGSTFVQGEIPRKIKDPGLFTLPCRLGDLKPFDNHWLYIGSFVLRVHNPLSSSKSFIIGIIEETDHIFELALAGYNQNPLGPLGLLKT
ncbi:hypothetical protein Tco_0939837 [Tanacetum coccineum]|uniref:MAK10-like protein n=1 Tax=Tanacetum coccineum TaxID=301880 RepID=A0ABQ5DLP3_9ASTR